MPLDQYCHQNTNNFEKLLEQEDAKNILKIATPIFLTIGMHIRPTKLLEVSPPNVQYNLEQKLRKECTSADWYDYSEIEKAMAEDNNKDDDKKNS